ncbi:MAG: ABC transporter ATP-binding protein [Polyangiaceae bacterium]
MSAAIGVRAKSLRRVFDGGVVAVDDVTLEFAAGAFVALLGPSGCGKSTLLRMIAGLDRPTSGALELEGPRAPRDLSFVFQDAHLLPWRSVLDNVALPLELSGAAKSVRVARAREAIAEVGLTDAASRFPAELSGGMRMRASLARAVVTRPRLLLLDEPFAALDEITRQRLDDQLRALHQAHAMTVIFVTHSIAEAAYLADRAVVFSPRPARITLDHVIALPARRDAVTRSSPEFAREMGALQKGLEGPTP